MKDLYNLLSEMRISYIYNVDNYKIIKWKNFPGEYYFDIREMCQSIAGPTYIKNSVRIGPNDFSKILSLQEPLSDFIDNVYSVIRNRQEKDSILRLSESDIKNYF